MAAITENGILTADAENLQDREIFTLGSAFLVFLMGVGSMLGLWFLSGIIIMLIRIMS